MIIAEHPLKALLRKVDLSGRIAQWVVELDQYDIQYRPRTAIKGQVLASVVSEFSPHPAKDTPKHGQSSGTCQAEEFTENTWRLYVDGSSNNKGAGAGIVVLLLKGLALVLALRLDFKASNNESEYEALIASLRGAREFEAKELLVFCDSQLVTNQLSGKYQAKDERIAAYVKVTRELM